MEKKKKNSKDIVEKLNKKIEENKKNNIENKSNTKVEKKSVDEVVKNEKNSEKDKRKISSKVFGKIDEKMLKKILEFVEVFVYIISIIVVIFANLYGPIYIQMIPLLFILGVVGKLVFNRPVTTTVFGMIVAICAVYTTGVNAILHNLVISGCMALYIALGEVCAFFFQKSYLYISKKTKRKTKKALFSYLICIVTIIISMGIYNYTNSNYFELEKNKQRLNNYLNEVYSDKHFEIVNIKYNFLGEQSFVFDLKEKDQKRVYKFIVSKDEKFAIEDGYVKYEKETKEKNANEKLMKYLKDNNLKEKYNNVKIGVKSNEVDNFELEIIKQVEKIDDNATLDFSKLVASIINDLKKFEYFKEFEQIIISLESKEDEKQNLTSYLYIERYLNNDTLDITKDYEYIKKALNVEYID